MTAEQGSGALPSFTIHAVFPNFYDGTRVSYSFKAIVESMRASGVPVAAYVLGGAREACGDGVHALLPMRLYDFTSALIRSPCELMVRRFGHRFKPGDVAYLWLTNPPAISRALQRRGLLVVREMINCTLERRREEMTHAYQILSWGNVGITDEEVERERRELVAADAVFCPNEGVLDSVRASGVAPERCLKTSYGWSALRLQGTGTLPGHTTGVSFLFVGTGDVRKGFPWLLQAWERAGITGRLLVAGTIEPKIEREFAAILSRSDVVTLGHVADIGAVYRSADVFCFPSWEEGGPMVTIEAMGMGLPCIVTPMGSAGIVSATSGGAIIVPPGDVEAIAAAMRRLAADEPLRRRLGGESRAIAARYTWDEVGRRRILAVQDLRARQLSVR